MASRVRWDPGRLAGAAIALAGLVILGLSFQPWRVCHTTPCGGPLQAFSVYTGVALGFGVATGAAGLALLGLGVAAGAGAGGRRAASAAALAGLVVTLTAGAALGWMRFLAPGDGEGWLSPSVVVVAVLGLGVLLTAARLRGARR